MKGAAWTIGAAGAWLAASPFLGFVPRNTPWNDLAVGVVVAVLGFRMARARAGLGWIAGLLGVWLVGIGLLPSAKTTLGAGWHDVLVGAALAAVGLMGVGVAGPAPVAELFPRSPRVRD